MTLTRTEVIALVCATLLVPLSYVAGRAFDAYVSKDAHEVAGYTSADPCPGESGLSSTCWSAYYTAFLAKYPAALALQDLKARYDAGGGAITFCHPLLHLIGEAAGKEYGSVASAYKHGETFCRAGYYHGVLEGIFGEEGGDTLISQLDSICAEIPGKERYSYNYFSCVHGIGHGLMAYFQHDLFESLAACEKLSGEWEQSSCAGGVFMQNVIGDTQEEPSRFLKKDDPLYPCNAVADNFRGQCYLMQTSHVLVVFNGDFAKTFALCRSIEAQYRMICFESLGRDASGWSYGDGEATLSLCAVGKTLDERKECLIGAAVDYIQSVSPDEARSLCALGEAGVRVPCIQAVENNLRTL